MDSWLLAYCEGLFCNTSCYFWKNRQVPWHKNVMAGPDPPSAGRGVSKISVNRLLTLCSAGGIHPVSIEKSEKK